MNQHIQTALQSANVLNGTFKLTTDCSPLYIGLASTDSFKTCLTFQLFPLENHSSDFPDVTLSLYLKQITSDTTFTGGLLHIGILSSGSKPSSMFPTQITASLTSEMTNSYIHFNLSTLIKNYIHYNDCTLNIVVFPDPDLNALCSFDSANSIHPPFLTFNFGKDCKDSRCNYI